VLQSISSQPDDTVPALRPITVHDLLTYRMGFGSVMARRDTYPIQKLIREYRIGGDGPMLPEKLDRLPGFYFFNRQTNALDLFDDIANSAWRTEPPFESGGGGLSRRSMTILRSVA
jgi:hypothetical protein